MSYSLKENIVDHESVSDPESSTEMSLHCVLMMHLVFFKNSVTHFPTLLCLLDKCDIVHDQQKTEVMLLRFLSFTISHLCLLLTEHSFETNKFKNLIV